MGLPAPPRFWRAFRGGRSLPPAPDVLYPGQDDVAAAACHPGQRVDDLPEQGLHLLLGGGHRVDVELVFAGHPVNLGHRLIARQDRRHLRQGLRQGLDLEVAGHRAADPLGVDDSGILLDDPPPLQGLDPGLHRHPGNPHRLADVGVGHPGVLNQQPDDPLVQLVQSVQEHGPSPLLCFWFFIIGPMRQNVNIELTFAGQICIMLSNRNT